MGHDNFSDLYKLLFSAFGGVFVADFADLRVLFEDLEEVSLSVRLWLQRVEYDVEDTSAAVELGLAFARFQQLAAEAGRLMPTVRLLRADPRSDADGAPSSR